MWNQYMNLIISKTKTKEAETIENSQNNEEINDKPEEDKSIPD